MRKHTHILFTVFLCLFLITIVSCSPEADLSELDIVSQDTDSTAEVSETEEYEGYFIDAPSAGLYYKAYPSGLCGLTGRSGNFRYRRNDTITFYLGTHQIGYSVSASRCISPLSIAHATTIYGTQNEVRMAQNIIRFFMAMNTGFNPYGLIFPATFGYWNGNLLNILTSSYFDTEVIDVIAALRGVLPSEVVLPSIEEAQKHFLISQSLISQLEANASKNFYVSVKVPAAFKNSYIDIAFNADQYPSGSNQYNSGIKALVSNSATASFSTQLHEANWQLTLTAMQNNARISSGDLISFYTGNGFSATPDTGYSLAMTNEKELLHADLTNGNNAGIVESVHTYSGTITIPKQYPDGTELTSSSLLEQKLFVDILDEENERAASIMLMLPVSETETWSETDETWTIPYSTTLADGYDYKVQLYWKPDSSKAYYVKETKSLGNQFSDDISNVEFSFDSWLCM